MTSMDSRRSSVSMLCTALGPFFLRYSTSARLLSMMWPSAYLQPASAAWASFYIAICHFHTVSADLWVRQRADRVMWAMPARRISNCPVYHSCQALVETHIWNWLSHDAAMLHAIQKKTG